MADPDEAERLRREIAALRAANGALAEANEALEALLFAVVHDLKSPVRKVRQFGELLEECCADQLTGEAGTFVAAMVGGADRATRALDALALYAAARQQPLSLAERRLSDIAEAATARLASEIADACARVDLDPLPRALCDAMLTEQLMVELLSNALRHRAPDRAPEIRVFARPGAILVQDNGPGVAPEHAERIFEPLTRLRAPRAEADAGGSGLGLTICKAICDRQGWRLSVHGEGAAGATFTIRLDARAAETGERP